MEFIYSILSSIGFNWHVALANFINFLIILFILNKYVFGKISKVVSDRNVLIKNGLENAESAEKKLRKAESERDDILSLAKKEGEAIVLSSTKRAETTARDITSRAENDADVLRTSLKDKITNAENSVENEFAKHAPALLANLLKKTLATNLSPADHDMLVAKLIAK